ncbi:MAG: hypothetical protein IT266_10445 [Saprospiraceae bacterium]|nr:hypothetical protein [Saprospiraceae bacterium]
MFMRTLAQITAYLFHPLLMVFAALFLLLCLKPHLFGVPVWTEQATLVVLIFIYTCFIPAVAMGLLRLTGLLKRLDMPERHDRFIPMIICAIFYLWLWINLKSQPGIPPLMNATILVSIVGVFMAFIANTLIKISLHGVAMGAFCTLWWLIRTGHSADGVLRFRFAETGVSEVHLHSLIAGSLIVAGWVGLTRLWLGAHRPSEWYLGLAVGCLSAILAFSYTF